MARTTLPDKYYYLDARSGTKYCATTETYDGDEDPIQTGEHLRFTIAEGGDHTLSKKKVLGTPVMGSGRG